MESDLGGSNYEKAFVLTCDLNWAGLFCESLSLRFEEVVMLTWVGGNENGRGVCMCALHRVSPHGFDMAR